MILIIDANVLISAAIAKHSIPDQVVRRALLEDVVIRSISTTQELSNSLKKKKLDRYFRNEYERDLFIHLFLRQSKLIEVTDQVRICRDPKDNQYLELALSGKADCIVSGDPDLQVLNPYENIPIISPREFLDRFS